MYLKDNGNLHLLVGGGGGGGGGETGFMYLKSPVMQFPSVRLSLLFLRAEYKICTYYIYTRKMVPITGRARSFLLVFKNKIERRGRQNKNNRPINLPNVITFSTDFKYTTQS